MGLDLKFLFSLSHVRVSLLPRYTIVGVILALRSRYCRDWRHGEAGGDDQEVVETRTRVHRWTRDLETHLDCNTDIKSFVNNTHALCSKCCKVLSLETNAFKFCSVCKYQSMT